MGKNYWMVVDTVENFQTTRDLGYTVFGVGPRYKRRAQRMHPSDRVLFYVKTICKWTATATISSNSFEDHTPIWKSTHKGDDFMYRVKITADVTPVEDDYIDALLLAPSLEYIKRWVPEEWPMAFQDRLHLLPQKDFRLIEGEMKRNLSKRRRRPRQYGADGAPAEFPVPTQEAAEEEVSRAEPESRLLRPHRYGADRTPAEFPVPNQEAAGEEASRAEPESRLLRPDQDGADGAPDGSPVPTQEAAEEEASRAEPEFRLLRPYQDGADGASDGFPVPTQEAAEEGASKAEPEPRLLQPHQDGADGAPDGSPASTHEAAEEGESWAEPESELAQPES